MLGRAVSYRAGGNTGFPFSFSSLSCAPQSLRNFLLLAPQDTSVVFGNCTRAANSTWILFALSKFQS